MDRWEYTKLNLADAPRRHTDLDALNSAGEDGWELVHVTDNCIAYLKRPVAPAAKAKREPAVPRTK